MFASDVNSPLKLPVQKEGSQSSGANGRKPSVSHGSAYGMSSPSTASRPGTRRRETAESSAFPSGGVTSPTGTGRFFRDDQSSWFGRRSTDTRESPAYDESEEDPGAPSSARPAGFGGLMRAGTSGAGGFGTASSMWGASSATPTTTAMGNFGSFAMPATTIGDKRFGGTRGESRLAHLLPKDSSEAMASRGSEAYGADAKKSIFLAPASANRHRPIRR